MVKKRRIKRMKMLNLKALIVIISICFKISYAIGESKDNTKGILGVGFNIGRQKLYGDDRYVRSASDYTFEGSLNYRFNKNFGIITSSSFGWLKSYYEPSATNSIQRSTNIVTLDMKGIFSLLKKKNFNMYVFSGVGVINFSLPTAPEKRFYEGAFILGSGFERMINEKVDFNTLFDYRLTTGDDFDGVSGGFTDGYLSGRIGLIYYFNKMQKKRKSKVIPAPINQKIQQSEIAINSKNTLMKGQTLPELIQEFLGISKTWAVVIGIDNYSKVKNGYSHLPYAVKDAKHIKNSLITNMGLPINRIFTLYNDNATKKNIEKLLCDSLSGIINKNDRLLVYFSGHGETYSTTIQKYGYLIPVDGQKDNLYSTCISMKQITDFSNIIPANQILFIIDACYSGIAGIVNKSSEEKLKNVSKAQIKLFMESRGRQIMTAGSSKETALMGEKWTNHSVYTHFLVKGLRGEADYNKDRIISTSELQVYLETNVSVATEGKQNPQLHSLGVTEGQFIFYREGDF